MHVGLIVLGVLRHVYSNSDAVEWVPCVAAVNGARYSWQFPFSWRFKIR